MFRVPQWILDFGNLLGENLDIIGLIGFLLTLWQVIYIKRQQKVDEMRRKFSAICKLPASEVVEYGELYEEIFRHYGDFEGSTIIDQEYFNNTIGEYYGDRVSQIREASSSSKLRFPLIYKKAWLKSITPRLEIIARPCKYPDMSKKEKHELVDPAKEYLRKFQVESLPELLSSSGKNIWNGRTFDLKGLEEKDSFLYLSFMLGDYYNYVKYYDLIGKELYYEISESQKKGGIWWSGLTLRLRDSIKKENVFDFTNRQVKLGINVFVLMKKDDHKDGNYCTFIQKRESRQVEYPNFYHVAPAGTFQPLSEFSHNIINLQCNFQYTVLREFLEEIYGLEEADKSKSVDPFAIFRSAPGKLLFGNEAVKEEIKVCIPGKYNIIPTGFLVDLVTLKPELTVVLQIEDSDVYLKTIGKANCGNWEGTIKEFNIEDVEFADFLRQNLNIYNFLPAGAVALAEGLNYYYRTIKKKD